MCVIILCKSMQSTVIKCTGKDLTQRGDTANKSAQLIHHIVGFALYRTISHAKRYPKNEKLQRMRDCILSKFTGKGAPPVIDSKNKAYWTHILNRKCLVFVNDKAFPFFLKLGSVLIASEERDGSVLLEKVCKTVVSDPHFLVMWDAIVDSALEESESLDLLVRVVKIIAGTYGRGSMLKRMNVITQSKAPRKKTVHQPQSKRCLMFSNIY